MLDFEIYSEGAYIHWPGLNVHLGMEAIRVACDPELKHQYQRERLKDDHDTGLAIRTLREEAALRQSDIEGVSNRQVRRIEQGEVRARTATLNYFAEAHGLELNAYLNALGEAMNRISRGE